MKDTNMTTSNEQKKLQESELEQVYGGAGEIKSNYLATPAYNTKTNGPSGA